MSFHSLITRRTKRVLGPALVILAIVGIVTPLTPLGYLAKASAVGTPWYYEQIHEQLAQELAHRGDDQDNSLREKSPVTNEVYFYKQRALPGAYISPSAVAKGANQANQLPLSSIGGSWTELGPRTLNNGSLFPEPVSGRILSIAIDPANSNIIFIGSAQGGIWKTSDGGKTWTAETDLQASLAINTIAIDAKNPEIIFAGTGEDNLSCDSYHGVGVLRSTDGGAHWTSLGGSIFAGAAIGNILLDPRFEGDSASEHLIVGAGYSGDSNSATESCHVSTPAGQNPVYGVFTSSNGGASFTQTLNGGSLSGFIAQLGVSDMTMDPSNPNIIYAAMQEQGIFRSTNAGATWTNLDSMAGSGLPAPAPGASFDRIQLAIAPSNPKVLYAAFSNAVFLGTHMQAFKTIDGGAHWRNLTNVPDVCDGQCWYDMPVAVSPTDPNTVFIGGNANYAYIFTVFGFPSTPADCTTIAALSKLPTDCTATLVKSADGGSTWQDIELGDVQTSGPAKGFPVGVNTLHPDDHAITFDPSNPNIMYTGNDGGLFMTSNGGHSWNNLNIGLGTLQFQSVSIRSNGEIFGGTQDNGTEKFSANSGQVWNSVDGGDGGLVVVDPQNLNVAYHTYADAFFSRTDDDGLTWNEVDAPFAGESSSFYPAFGVAPTNGSTVYFGTFRIWRTDTGGGPGANGGVGAWNAISPDLTGTGGNCGFRCISAVAVSPTNANVVVVGTGSGKIWLSQNADAASPIWTEIDTSNLPNRFITQIVFAPNSQSKIFVTYSGFNSTVNSTHPGHVFVSNDVGQTGTTFTEIDGQTGAPGFTDPLPDLPTNSILPDPTNPHALFVAADYGVYYSANDGHSWIRLDGNLAHSEIYMIQYDPANDTIVVATHGRGMWAISRSSVENNTMVIAHPNYNG